MKSHLVWDNNPPAIVGELPVVGLRRIATIGAGWNSLACARVWRMSLLLDLFNDCSLELWWSLEKEKTYQWSSSPYWPPHHLAQVQLLLDRRELKTSKNDNGTVLKGKEWEITNKLQLRKTMRAKGGGEWNEGVSSMQRNCNRCNTKLYFARHDICHYHH